MILDDHPPTESPRRPQLSRYDQGSNPGHCQSERNRARRVLDLSPPPPPPPPPPLSVLHPAAQRRSVSPPLTMGASTVAAQRPLPLPDTQSTRYPNTSSTTTMTTMTTMTTTIPSDSRLGVRSGSPLTGAARRPSFLPPPLSSAAADTTKAASAPRTSVLTPPGAVSDGFSPSGPHGSNSQSSHAGGAPLYYAGHMTGSWPTPGLSQASAYTYANPTPGAPGSAQLSQPPYSRGPAPYASVPSPSHQHFPGRASSAPNGESIPAPQSYHDQQGYSNAVGVGGPGAGGGASLGSPLDAHGPNAQSMLGNPPQGAARHPASGQSTPGAGPPTGQDGGPYRPPSTPTGYYPQTSAPQQPAFPTYASPVTQPSPTTASAVTTSGAIPRGAPAIPAMAPPLQYSGARSHPVPSMGSYASYSPNTGPVLSNMHHPGAPLAMVGGIPGMTGYGHHPGLSAHHPHHLYVHHGGAPSTQSERPFKCSECTQAFNRNHDLKRHQRIHLAIKPFGCDDCDKRFSRKDALKVSWDGGWGGFSNARCCCRGWLVLIFVQRHRLVKGCGGTSSEGANGTSGGKETSPHDRDGDRDGTSPGLTKKL